MIANSSSTINRISLPVNPEDSEVWQAAATRFDEHRLRLIGYRVVWTSAWRLYDIESYSQPNSWHEIEVIRTGDSVYTTCDCDAAFHGTVCQHAAAALRDSGWAPFELLMQPALLPDTERCHATR